MHRASVFDIDVIPVLSAIAIESAADSPNYEINAHIIAMGTSIQARSSCFGLDATIAEPAAAFFSGGIYDLSTGFAVASPIVTDTIFAGGFEDCKP